MQFELTDKKILLGVTGSISAYKACELARLFVKAGAEVYVVMTPSAERFVSALTFEALTRNPVLTEASESWAGTLNHIDTAKRCDLFVIAPATANTLNKLSKGIADNILLQTALAFGGKLIVAPAANTQMLQNHYTTGSLKMLAVNDIAIVKPQEKKLACGDVGTGALAEPVEIYLHAIAALLEAPFWKDRRVVVTGGGTREKIDEVRYLSNFSSGKMARALALALYARGADVCYITSNGSEGLPEDLYVIDVESAQEMLDYTVDAIRVAKKGKMSKATMNSSEPMHLIQKRPFLFMAAAVSDFTPKYPQKGKLKKRQIGTEWSLELTATPDILATINKDGIYTVAFKAEMDSEKGLSHAREMLESKEVDAVCYNLLTDSESFGTDDNEITLITRERDIQLGRTDKLTLALNLLENLEVLEK
jgi:phosphopantothenoylcysteine decarboxylase/phosphopantothenate--cysteine ligase